MAESGRLRELEEKYEGYTVYDRDGDKIGKVDELFVDETDREEYIGVKMGLFGLSGTTLVPMDIARLNEQDRTIEVSETKSRVKDAPTYSDDDDVTNEFEERIRGYYNLESRESSGDRGMYGGAGSAEAGAAGAGAVGGAEDREDRGAREGPEDREGLGDRSMYGGAAGAGAGAVGGAESREGHGDRERRERPEGLRDREGIEDREGRESYQNREGMGGSGSAMESAGAGRRDEPSGGVEQFETGERGRTSGSGAVEGDEARRRSGAGSDVGDEGVADREAAARYAGAPVEEPGSKEFDDMQDYQSAATGQRPGGERERTAGMDPAASGTSGGVEGRRPERGGLREEGEHRGTEEPRSVDIERGTGEPPASGGREETGSLMGDREEREGPVRVRRRSRQEQSSIDEEESEFRRER